MKHAAALAFLLLFALRPATASAQIGVHGGWVSSTLSTEGSSETDRLNGLNVGASYTFSLSPAVGLEVGAEYTEKGGIIRTSEEALAVDFVYGEVPVLFRLERGLTSSLAVHGRAGPVISVELSCDAEFRLVGGGISQGPCANTESVDIGAAIGGGFSVRVKPGLALTGDVLYNLGLRSATQVGDTRNRALMVQGGLRFTPGS